MVINSNSSRDSIFGLFLTLCLVGLSIFFTSIKEVDKTIFVIEKGMSLNTVTNLLHEKDIIHNKSFFKYGWCFGFGYFLTFVLLSQKCLA